MLVDENHLLLSTKLEKFNFNDESIDLPLVISQMVHVMVESNGIGLSANQIGYPYRMFVMKTKDDPMVIINPKVVSISEEEVYMNEGCLTYPNLFVKIKRPSECKIRFQNAEGVYNTINFGGMSARCALHEIDHLDGYNFLQRAKPFHMQNAKRKKKILDRKLKKKETV